MSFLNLLDGLFGYFVLQLLNLKNKIMKIERKKIFCGPSKIFKNISWPVSICLKYFMTPTKTIRPPSYMLNVRSLKSCCLRWCMSLIDISLKKLVIKLLWNMVEWWWNKVYSWLLREPNMCDKSIANYADALEFVLDCYKTQKCMIKLLILILLQCNLFVNIVRC